MHYLTGSFRTGSIRIPVPKDRNSAGRRPPWLLDSGNPCRNDGVVLVSEFPTQDMGGHHEFQGF